MTASQYLLSLPRHYLPMSIEKPSTRPTNSEVRRWLRNKAVIINGLARDEFWGVCFPVWELVYFPKGERRTTVVSEL